VCILRFNHQTHTLGQYNAKTVLLMSKGLSSDVQAHFFTHHPSEILVNETFKREAWEVLKQILAFSSPIAPNILNKKS
jgi:uracil-DNA glycosylase